jgi:competence ComEA-like helix-hairpin-helix protein
LAATLCCAVAEAREPWIVFKDCRTLSNESNDADSFHVKAGGKEYIFRLYFVDAAETDAEFPERVAEQAKYFGLTAEQTTKLGDLARRFTKEKLTRPFTVRTCLQEAMGRSKKDRYYAFIETAEGDLAELLVANGLARLHGSAAQPAGLSSPEREWRKLRQLEQAAKQQKVGAWGAPVGRMAARSSTAPAKSGPDSFTAFFHPERVAVVSAEEEETEPAIAATPVPAEISTPAVVQEAAPAAAGKLDVNSATADELENIPGVGPVLAERIIAARPFQSADDLSKVKGVGSKRYERIRPLFR